MKAVDGLDPEAVRKEEELAENIEDSEISLIEAIEGARAALGDRQEHALDVGVDVAEKELETWDKLADRLKDLLKAKKIECAEARNPPALPPGQVRSKRSVNALINKADNLEKAVAEIAELEEALRVACAAVVSARGAADAFSQAPRDDGAPTGALGRHFKDLLAEYNINAQAYWSGTLVGPDARRFLTHFAAILGQLKTKMAETHGQETSDAFYKRHCTCLKPLAVVVELTRKVEMLTAQQLDDLEAACKEFVGSFRTLFPDHSIVAPKFHVIEKHIPYFARRFETCGVFGEDGLESLHPMDSRARLIVRTIRNPVKRHKAATKHLLIKAQHSGAKRLRVGE